MMVCLMCACFAKEAKPDKSELQISEKTGYLNITHTNLCKKHLTYTNNLINNYNLYKVGDILCEENFPNENKGNAKPSPEVLTIIE